MNPVMEMGRMPARSATMTPSLRQTAKARLSSTPSSAEHGRSTSPLPSPSPSLPLPSPPSVSDGAVDDGLAKPILEPFDAVPLEVWNEEESTMNNHIGGEAASAPLLPGYGHEDDDIDTVDENGAGKQNAEAAKLGYPTMSTKRAQRILLMACVVGSMVDCAMYLNMAPRTKLLEDILCREQYGQRGFDTGTGTATLDCKEESVQTAVAMVLGWADAFGQLSGILFALPYGVMADQYGRKTVLLLALLSGLLSDTWVKVVYMFPNTIPVRYIWFAPLLHIIGGGAQVTDLVICTIIADLVPDHERVNAFLKFTAIELLAAILATPLAAALMKISPWCPLALSSVVILGAGLLASMLPETRWIGRKTISDDHREAISEGDSSSKFSISRAFEKLNESLSVIWTNKVILLYLFVFFIGSFGAHAVTLLLQYTSKRFDWDYSTASLVITFKSLFHLALAAILMPLLDRYLTTRLNYQAAQKDFRLSQWSAILLTLGFLALGLSGHPVGLVLGIISVALGSSFLVTLRSTMTVLVPASSVGTLYTAATLVQGISGLVAGPLLALVFHWGMVLGNAFMGLPFLLASGLHGLALLVMMGLKAR